MAPLQELDVVAYVSITTYSKYVDFVIEFVDFFSLHFRNHYPGLLYFIKNNTITSLPLA